MRDKIRILMSFIETYEANIKDGVVSKKYIINTIIGHFASYTPDQAWYRTACLSFEKAMLEEKKSEEWLIENFQTMGIFAASEQLQGRSIPQHHCMTFVYHFFNDTLDENLCNLARKIHPRIAEYVKNFSAIESRKLEPGNIIAYYNLQEKKYTHIAIFIGEFNGKRYAVSKLGENFGVYIHPIELVPTHYGSSLCCYQSKTPLPAKAAEKLHILQQELQQKLKPALADKSPTTILTSGLGLLSLNAFDKEQDLSPQPVSQPVSPQNSRPLI